MVLWYRHEFGSVCYFPVRPSAGLGFPHYDPISFSKLVLSIVPLGWASLDDFCDPFVSRNKHVSGGLVESWSKVWFRRVCPLDSIELQCTTDCECCHHNQQMDVELTSAGFMGVSRNRIRTWPALNGTG